MRIVVDCRYTRFDHHDGISRFTSSLVTELATLHPVIMLINDHRQLALLPDVPWELVNAPTSIREPFVGHRVNRLRPDVVYSPMQTMGSFGRRYALVLTVHDLIYYRHRTPPRNLPAGIRLLWRLYHLSWLPQRMLLNRADAVVAVSETTKALIARHELTIAPVTVVYNAAGASLRQLPLPTGALARTPKRLVYMGSFMPYKNVDTLVRATAELPGYELHLMSRVEDAERQRLTRLAPQAQLVFHNGASDEEYVDTLRSAVALVSTSFDEGFGIPLVEAMSLGVPVVVSDIPIFREIGADAALYVDPHRHDLVAEAVRSLEEPGEWERRSVRSRAVSERFSWDRSARTLLDVLREVTRRDR